MNIKKIPGIEWDPRDFREYFDSYYLIEIPKPVETTLYWALV